MNRLGLLCATCIATGAIAIAGVSAGDANPEPQNVNYVMMSESVQRDRVRSVKAPTFDRSNDVFNNISVQSFLETLSDVQLALHNDLHADAYAELEKAVGQLDKLIERDKNGDDRINSLDVRDLSERKVIDVRFGHVIEPDQAIMPAGNVDLTASLLADLVEVDALEQGSIEEAKVRYISYNLDYEDVRPQLLQAKKEMNEGDYTSAQFDVLQVQTRVVNDRDEMMVPARIQALDHIELARFLLSEGEYVGARQALETAEDAVSVLSGGTDDAIALMNIRRSVDDLREQLSQQEISLLDKIDVSLERIWDLAS